MRYLPTVTIVLYLLACPGTSLGASWKQLGNTLFVDENTVRQEGNIVSLFAKIYYTPEQIKMSQESSKKKKKPQYIIVRDVFNCKERKVTAPSWTEYSSKGDPVESYSNQYKAPEDILPDSIAEALFEYACSLR